MKRLLWWSTTTSYDDECDENTCHAMTPNKVRTTTTLFVRNLQVISKI